MKTQRTRKWASWILLAVYLPMLLLSSLHIHHDHQQSAQVVCNECVHHLPHPGHITNDSGSMHPCVLCQFLSLPFLTADDETPLAVDKLTASLLHENSQPGILSLLIGTVGLRAPPALLL